MFKMCTLPQNYYYLRQMFRRPSTDDRLHWLKKVLKIAQYLEDAQRDFCLNFRNERSIRIPYYLHRTKSEDER